jgi:hypothetical protein
MGLEDADPRHRDPGKCEQNERHPSHSCPPSGRHFVVRTVTFETLRYIRLMSWTFAPVKGDSNRHTPPEHV